MSHNVLPTVRELTAHRVNGLNEVLRAFVLDAPGHGGACHSYIVLVPMEAHDAMCEDHQPRENSRWTWYQLSRKASGPGEFCGVNMGLDGNDAVLCAYDTADHDAESTYYNIVRVPFQNGPIKEYGVNGISQEVLLAILLDRLEGFQAGDYKCKDNEMALTKIQEARLWLHKRTMDRVSRGVEGTMAQ